MRGWMLVAVAGCLTLALIACAAGTAGGALLFTRTPRGQQLLESFRARPPVNRLLVLGDDSNIFTVRPDGSDRVALTTDADSRRFYRQPTWSPVGDKVAWVEIDTRESELRSALITGDPDGRERTRIETPYPPFYLSWSPDGKYLAYLSNWTDGLALRLIEIAAPGADIVTLDQGQPLYFSWAPDGRRILTHIGSDHLGMVDLDGTGSALDANPAFFPAPQWSPDGGRLVYAIRDGSDQFLVASEPDGSAQQVVTRFDGFISFTMSPDSRQIAYALTPEPVGTAAFGPLYVADLDTRQARQLSAEPVLAFFWSPDSRALIFLRPEVRAPVQPAPEAAPLRQQQIWLRWHLWDGTRTRPLALFSPSDTFLLDYLRFFDQYAQSMTLWAPDSSAFVYAGMDENGLQGIWVHPVSEESRPVRVARGLFAAWSPR